MSDDKSMLRNFVGRVEGVSRTHYEIEIKGSNRHRTLVVGVDFDLDPSSSSYSRAKVDSIAEAFATILREENGDIVSNIKILGRSQQQTDRSTEISVQGASSKVGGGSQKGATVSPQSSSH